MAPFRNSWSFSIHLYWDFSKSWSQIQKVGVNYSKFGVNETSVVVLSLCTSHLYPRPRPTGMDGESDFSILRALV